MGRKLANSFSAIESTVRIFNLKKSFNKRLLLKKMKKACRFGSVEHHRYKGLFSLQRRDHGNRITNNSPSGITVRWFTQLKLMAHIPGFFVIPRINYKSRKTNKEISKQNKYLDNVWLRREVGAQFQVLKDTGKSIVSQNVSRRAWN